MKSIRRQLSVGMLGVFAVLAGGGGALVYFSTRAALLAQIDARLRVEALSIMKQFQEEQDEEGEHGENHPEKAAERRFRALEASTGSYLPEFQVGGTEYFQIMSPEAHYLKSASLGRAALCIGEPGRSIKASDREPRYYFCALQNVTFTIKAVYGVNSIAGTWVDAPSNHPDVLSRSNDVKTPAGFGFPAAPGSVEVRAVSVNLTINPTGNPWSSGWSILTVASGLGQFNRTLSTLRVVLFGVGGLGGLVVLLTVPVVLRRGLLPIQSVATRASELDATTLQARFPEENIPSELRPICVRLNELLARLERSFERERRFSADVAHELRTPIAELRSLAEVSLKWPPAEGAGRRAFGDTLAIAKQMEGIVASLLGITRCEAGRQVIQRERVKLTTLVEEHWRPFAAVAEEKRLVISKHGPVDSQVETDPVLAGLILSNLFSNVVDYTPPGGAVMIQLFDETTKVVLSVTNVTENLTADDVPKLFERFWRKDTVRTSSGHSGLGLALAKACAEILEWRLTAKLTIDGMLVMAVERD